MVQFFGEIEEIEVDETYKETNKNLFKNKNIMIEKIKGYPKLSSKSEKPLELEEKALKIYKEKYKKMRELELTKKQVFFYIIKRNDIPWSYLMSKKINVWTDKQSNAEKFSTMEKTMEFLEKKFSEDLKKVSEIIPAKVKVSFLEKPYFTLKKEVDKYRKEMIEKIKAELIKKVSEMTEMTYKSKEIAKEIDIKIMNERIILYFPEKTNKWIIKMFISIVKQLFKKTKFYKEFPLPIEDIKLNDIPF